MRCQGSAQENKLGGGPRTRLIKEEEVKRLHATATSRPLQVPRDTGIASQLKNISDWTLRNRGLHGSKVGG